jgi:tetratricopeptide (TPR) repeat protein
MAIAAAIFAALLVLPIATVRLTAQTATPSESGVLEGIRQGLRKEVASTVTHTVSALAASLNEKQARHSEHADSRSGAELFQDGREAFSSEDYERAVSDYRKAIELGYRPATSMYNLACAYSQKGEGDNAIAWLGKAIDAGFDDREMINSDSDFDPIRSDPRFIRLVSDKSSRENSQLDSLRARGSRNAEEWAKVGAKLLNHRDLPSAISALSEAIRLDPFLGNAWYNLGCAYALSGDSRRALDTIEQSLLHGFSGDGDKLLSDDDLDSIHSPQLDQLAKLADDLALRNDGWARFFSWSDAIARYEAIARAHPNIARAWFNLGFAQCEGHQERAAVQSFQRALSMAYRPGTTMYNIGCSYAQLGDRQTTLS